MTAAAVAELASRATRRPSTANQRALRAGTSTRAWVTIASTSEIATARVVATQPMRPSTGAQRAVRAKTRHGQCHRYQAYEILPT